MFYIYKCFHFLLRNKNIFLILFAISSYLTGFFIYKYIYGLSYYQSVYYAITQFLGEVKTPFELGITTSNEEFNKCYYLIYISAFFAFFTTVFVFILTFFKDYIYKLTLSSIVSSGNHIIICGLGKNNRYFLDSILDEEKNKKIIAVENNRDNPYIKKYEEKGVYFILDSAEKKETLNKLNFSKCDYIIISTGNDILNLNIATNIAGIIKHKTQCANEKKTNLYLHFSKRNFEMYISEKVFFESKCNLNVQYYSYNENSARDLFLKKSLIEGVNTVTRREKVKLLIIGFGDLGQEVAIQAAKLGSFYNGEKLEITIVDKDQSSINSFFSLHKKFKEICDVNIFNFDVQSIKFNEEIIEKFNATYVVFSLADDNITMCTLTHLVSNIKQQRFLHEEKLEKDIVLPPIAVRFSNSNNINLEKIDKSIFKFGVSEKISSKDKIIDAELDNNAKDLNLSYVQEKKEKRENEWEKLDNFTKDSNRASVDHWKIKKATLKKLELEKKDIFNNEEESKKPSNKKESKKLSDYDEKIQKLIIMEKVRWNNFHYLNNWINKSSEDWNKDKVKYKEYKVHTCLVPTSKLDDLNEKHNKNYYENDLKSYKMMFNKEK